MLSTLLNIVFQDYATVFLGICAGLICKAYFNSRMKSKIKEYQNDILKSNAKIYELEVLNEELSKRLTETEFHFSKDHIILN